MRPEPRVKRALSFIDGQNLYRHAKSAFGHHHPNYDPIKLSEAVCAASGWTSCGARFYTGNSGGRSEPDVARLLATPVAYHAKSRDPSVPPPHSVSNRRDPPSRRTRKPVAGEASTRRTGFASSSPSTTPALTTETIDRCGFKPRTGLLADCARQRLYLQITSGLNKRLVQGSQSQSAP